MHQNGAKTAFCCTLHGKVASQNPKIAISGRNFERHFHTYESDGMTACALPHIVASRKLQKFPPPSELCEVRISCLVTGFCFVPLNVTVQSKSPLSRALFLELVLRIRRRLVGLRRVLIPRPMTLSVVIQTDIPLRPSNFP